MMPFVLIVSHFYEPSVNEVIKVLDDRGVRWARFNTETFPLATEIEWRLDTTSHKPYAVLQIGGESIDTRRITSVWYRRVGRPLMAKGLGDSEKQFVENECWALIHGVVDCTTGIRVNDRIAELNASNKMYQLGVAREIGFRVPETLITNDALSVRSFAKRFENVLFKPISGVASQAVDFSAEVVEVHGSTLRRPAQISKRETHFDAVYSQILDNDKAAQLDNLAICPAIFQEYIPKLLEVRATIVGDRIFSCEIHSQENAETKVDFRRFASLQKDKRPLHKVAALPKRVAEKLMTLMKLLGLNFACIDLIKTPDNEFVFLEVNPSGQWLWIEKYTGLPITSALADLLTS